MSTTIDERVVSMQFDNKQFESNVKTSMSTIDKLKKSLNFNGVSKSLKDLEHTSKRYNCFTPLADGIDAVKVKFTATQVFMVSALHDLYNTAKYYAKSIVSAFTLDPVKSGFQEYEAQINAVQTILANTQSKGTTLDDVNNALDTLNKYADKTIYNFTEMTRNIGTFTAAGIDLETAVNAIQGIANLAAVSGSNSQQASTAMYQLSQALASGTVKLMDWNSVVNAGMGGQVFQDALKETARVHGIAIDDMIKKQGSFRETLSDGWLTSEILTETLQKFTLTTEGLTNAQIEQNKAMLKAKGYTDEQIKGIFKLGETATDAATKVKTFTQLMDTLKEAAQSGWTQTWELLVGDFDQAKEVWTKVSDRIGGMINDSAERRNSFLSEVLSDSTWGELIDKISDAGVGVRDFEDAVTNTLKKSGYDVARLVQKYGSLENVFKRGAVSSDLLKNALKSLDVKINKGSTLDLLDKVLKFGKNGEDVKQLEEALVTLGYSITGGDGVDYSKDGFFGTLTRDAIKQFQKDQGLKVTGIVDEETINALKKATTSTVELDDSVWDLVDGVSNLGGRDLLIKGLGNAFESLLTFIRPVKKAFKEIFSTTPAQVYDLIRKFSEFTEAFRLDPVQMAKLQVAFEGLFSVIGIGLDFVNALGGGIWDLAKKIFPVLGDGLLDAGAELGWWLKNLRKSIQENKTFSKIISFATSVVDKGINKVKEWYGKVVEFLSSPGIQNWFEDFKNKLGATSSAIIERLQQVGSRFADFFKKIQNGDFSSISEAFADFKTNIIDFLISTKSGTIFDNLINSLKKFKSIVLSSLEGAGAQFDNIKASVSNFFESIKTWASENSAILLALGSLAGTFSILVSLRKLIVSLLGPISGFNSLCGDLGLAIQKIGKAYAIKTRAEALLVLAKAVALLAGSIVALSFLGPLELGLATSAIALLVGGIIGICIAVGKAGNNIKGLGETIKVIGLIAGVAGALTLMAIAIEKLGRMSLGELFKGTVAITVLMALIEHIAESMSGIKGKAFNDLGKMAFSLSASLLLVALAINALGNMKTETLVKGGLAIAAFLGMMVIVIRSTNGFDSEIPKFGSMILGISAALLTLSLVAGILGKMKTETLLKGGTAIAAFLAMMVGMMAATKLLKRDLPSFGGTMWGISAGLLAMAASIAIISKMDMKALLKGGLVASAFLGMMVGLMAATDLMSKNKNVMANLGKIGIVMISFSAALLLVSASIAALSLIEGMTLAKAMAATTGIGIIFAGLIAVTRLGKDMAWASLIGIAGAIAILSGAVIALAYVPIKKLFSATLAIFTIVGLFSKILKTASNIKIRAVLSVIGMAAAVAGLALVMKGISDTIDSKSAKNVSSALSILLLSLAASTYLLAKTTNIMPKDISSVKAMGKAMLVLAGIATLFGALTISSLPWVGLKLSEFAKAAAPFFAAVIGMKIGNIEGVATAISSMASLTSAIAKFAYVDAITFGAATKAFNGLATWFDKILPVIKQFAIDLSVNGLTINSNNLNAVMGAVNLLAKAAASAPSIMAAGGGFKSKWGSGGGGVISWPLLKEAKDWIVAVAPLVKDLATIPNIGILDTAKLTTIVGSAKTLAEAASLAPSVTIGGVGGGFASKWITGGGGAGVISWPLLEEAKNWIVGIRPVIDSLARLTSTTAKDINAENLNTIVGSAVTLAEAASLAPTVDIMAGGFGSKWIIGGGAVIEWPLLNEAKDWIAGVKTVLVELAKEVSSGVTINGDNLTTIVTSAKTLAEAASIIPKRTYGLGTIFSLPLKLFGVGGFQSISMLDETVEWISGIKQPLIDLAKACTTGVGTINTENLDAILGAATTLSECIAKVPKKIEAGGGFGGAGILGKIIGAIGGGFGFQSIPMLTEAAAWIGAIKDTIIEFVKACSGESVGEINTENLDEILGAALALSESTSKIPKKIVGGGGLLGASAALLGGFIGGFGFQSISMLDEASQWISDIKQPLIDFASACSTKVETINTDNLDAILGAALVLSEAAGKVPRSVKASGGLGGLTAWLGGVIGGGGSYESIPMLTEAANWFKAIKEPIIEFAKEAAISDDDVSSLKNLDIEKFTALTTAVQTLSEAAINIPKTAKASFGFGGISALLGGVFGGGGEYVETVEFDRTTKWFGDVVPKVNGLAEIISQSTVDIDNDRLTSVTTAVKTLAGAAKDIPETSWVKETFTGVTDFEGFTGFLSSISEPLETLSISLSDKQIDPNKVSAAATSLKTLAQASDAIPNVDGFKQIWEGETGWDNFKTNLPKLGEAIATFSSNVLPINVEAVTAASRAVYAIANMVTTLASGALGHVYADTWSDFNALVPELADTIVAFSEKVSGIDSVTTSAASGAIDSITNAFTKLSGFDYSTVNIEDLKTKTDELGTAIQSFSTEFNDIDSSGAVESVNKLVDMLSNMSTTSLDGPKSLKFAIEELGTISIDDFVKAFTKAEDDVKGAAETFIGYFVAGIADNTSTATGATQQMAQDCIDSSGDKYSGFSGAGGYLVEGFAAGITASTWKAEAQASAMAQAALDAAKAILKINSPSKVFMKVGQSVPEGFAMGIDQFGGLVDNSVNTMADGALSGTKSAISRLSDIVDEGIDTNPTIRPVLDLTDVESGANSISGMFSMKPSVGVMANVGAISSMMNNNQNGSNSDVIAAIENLGRKIGNTSGDTYNVNGITYDDGSNVSDAVKTLVRAARVERRR